MFFDWLNPVYISQEIQNDIRERFEAESELELVEFLKVFCGGFVWVVTISDSVAFPPNRHIFH